MRSTIWTNSQSGSTSNNMAMNPLRESTYNLLVQTAKVIRYKTRYQQQWFATDLNGKPCSPVASQAYKFNLWGAHAKAKCTHGISFRAHMMSMCLIRHSIGLYTKQQHNPGLINSYELRYTTTFEDIHLVLDIATEIADIEVIQVLREIEETYNWTGA